MEEETVRAAAAAVAAATATEAIAKAANVANVSAAVFATKKRAAAALVVEGKAAWAFAE